MSMRRNKKEVGSPYQSAMGYGGLGCWEESLSALEKVSVEEMTKPPGIFLWIYYLAKARKWHELFFWTTLEGTARERIWPIFARTLLLGRNQKPRSILAFWDSHAVLSNRSYCPYFAGFDLWLRLEAGVLPPLTTANWQALKDLGDLDADLAHKLSTYRRNFRAQASDVLPFSAKRVA